MTKCQSKKENATCAEAPKMDGTLGLSALHDGRGHVENFTV